MTRVLILDDDPQRHETFLRMFASHDIEVRQAFTAQQAINILNLTDRFDLVCLDHDLGEFSETLIGEPGCGMDVAEFIFLHIDQKKLPKQVLIHSWNAPAAKRMEETIRGTGIKVLATPFKATWRTVNDIGR